MKQWCRLRASFQQGHPSHCTVFEDQALFFFHLLFSPMWGICHSSSIGPFSSWFGWFLIRFPLHFLLFFGFGLWCLVLAGIWSGMVEEPACASKVRIPSTFEAQASSSIIPDQIPANTGDQSPKPKNSRKWKGNRIRNQANQEKNGPIDIPVQSRLFPGPR